MTRTAGEFLSAAQTASHFGVTPRALRVYERSGLIEPTRTAAGWRVYGPAEFERLYLILTLKAFGLTLREIGALIAAGGLGLDQLLRTQEAALRSQMANAEKALASLSRARQRLARDGHLDLDDLVELNEETNMPEWAEKLTGYGRENLSAGQLQALKDRMPDAAEMQRVQDEWAAVFADAERLAGGDPADEEALALAARAAELMQAFTQGDGALEKNTGGAWKKAWADPDLAGKMPVSPQAWAFLQAAGANYRASL
ncbi:MerR family transcriptional regulator [uncultured Maricaulis sp.]|uniref:MerR family transcriptional regulator n=1 Tax=uncultured Maricaulis sp. TaxID=174710 RepID=UPI0030DD31CD|tara:strand:+ start:19173 stop:19943 length:771 start_codon:yes stop_codon:yes gene_type:complete